MIAFFLFIAVVAIYVVIQKTIASKIKIVAVEGKIISCGDRIEGQGFEKGLFRIRADEASFKNVVIQTKQGEQLFFRSIRATRNLSANTFRHMANIVGYSGTFCMVRGSKDAIVYAFKSDSQETEQLSFREDYEKLAIGQSVNMNPAWIIFGGNGIRYFSFVYIATTLLGTGLLLTITVPYSALLGRGFDTVHAAYFAIILFFLFKHHTYGMWEKKQFYKKLFSVAAEAGLKPPVG